MKGVTLHTISKRRIFQSSGTQNKSGNVSRTIQNFKALHKNQYSNLKDANPRNYFLTQIKEILKQHLRL